MSIRTIFALSAVIVLSTAATASAATKKQKTPRGGPLTQAIAPRTVPSVNPYSTAIDTLTNKVIATSPIGQAAQAVVYVPNAIPIVSENGNAAMTMMPVVPEGVGTQNLQPLGVAGLSTQLWLAPPRQKGEKGPTSVSLSKPGLGAGARGCGHRARTGKALRTCAVQ